MYDNLQNCVDEYGSIRKRILNKAKEEADHLVCEVYSNRYMNFMLIDVFEVALAY